MPEGDSWLWRPVLEGLCRYESLIDGTLDLGDVRLMNIMLDVRSVNQRIVSNYLKTHPDAEF